MSNGTKGWEKAPGLTRIAASQQGGSRGAQLWGILINNQMTTIFQETAGGSWSNWRGTDWAGTASPLAFDLAACQQNDGRVQLWTLDIKQQLWSTWQTSPGGGWTGWSGPNWDNAPALQTIAASQQGGTRGAQLWGITKDYTLISDFQVVRGEGWSGWSSGSWVNTPNVTQIAAAEQNNGCVRLWAITTDGILISISQTSPGGGWSAWE
jgi:hypothetical protein